MNDISYTLLVSGYRYFTNYEVVKSKLDAVVNELGLPTLVLQGECKTGVDVLAKRWCSENNLNCKGFPANWSHGNGAGPERNSTMISMSHVVCAFVHNQSRGTKDVIRKAKTASKILYVFEIE